MMSEQKRAYWEARIGSIVQASNKHGAHAIGTLLAVTSGVWGYGGNAVASDLDTKDDRSHCYWPTGVCAVEAN